MLSQIPTINCRFTSKSHFQTPPFFRSFIHAHRGREHRAALYGVLVGQRRGIPFLSRVYTPCVYPAAVRDCRVHKSAMTAEGRAFLPNKVGERNRNVGINEFIRSLSGYCRPATCHDKDLFILKSIEYLAHVFRATVNRAGISRNYHNIQITSVKINIFDTSLFFSQLKIKQTRDLEKYFISKNFANYKTLNNFVIVVNFFKRV